MEKEKDAVLEEKNSEEKNSENNSKDDEEDLLYTHKLDSQGNSMRWNSSFCRRPGN